MCPSMELVTGATGYVGSRLLGRLVSEGRPVRALARRPERVSGAPVVRGDLLTGAGLAEALEGCSTAYYLVHSMEAASNGNGEEEEEDDASGKPGQNRFHEVNPRA